jgi:hypothetical protein
MKFHLAPQRTRDWDAHGATFGYCASKDETYFGVVSGGLRGG